MNSQEETEFEILDIDEPEQDGELSFPEIYDYILRHGNVVLEILAADLNKLREGLATAKNRHNNKMLKLGESPPVGRLSVEILEKNEDKVKVQCRLVQGSGKKILATILPGA